MVYYSGRSRKNLISRWTFWTTLISIIIGLCGIALVFYTKSPFINFQILASTPVVSIQENVENLDVFFNDENIREKGKGLTLSTIKMVNTGNAPARTIDFDERYPLTLNITNGDLVDYEPLLVSEDYLNKVLRNAIINKDNITFPPFIMEPGEFASFRLLILHNENTIPEIYINGKIAGGGKDITDISKAATPGVVYTSLSGDIQVQFVRIFAYSAFAILFFLVIFKVFQKILIRLFPNGSFENEPDLAIKMVEFFEGLPQDSLEKYSPIFNFFLSKEEGPKNLIDCAYSTLAGLTKIDGNIQINREKYIKNLKKCLISKQITNEQVEVLTFLEDDEDKTKLNTLLRLVLFLKTGNTLTVGSILIL